MITRPIEEEDSKNFLGLLSAINREAPFIYTEQPISHEGVKKLIHDPHKQIYILEDNGAFIGYCITTLGVFPENAHVAKIQSMGIAPSEQNRGNGKLILSTVVEELKKDGRKIITLEVVDKNAPAVNLYKSLGFMETGRIKNAFVRRDDKCDIITMSLYI